MSGLYRHSFDDTSNAPETELLGGTDQTKIGNVGDRLKVNAEFTSPPNVQEQQFPTFVVLAPAVTSANNKSMISLQNAEGSSKKLKLRDIKIISTQNTPVTGLVMEFQLRRATSHSGGTLITPLSFDTADSLSSSLTARTGATITEESASIFMRWRWSTDEWLQGAVDVESYDHTMAQLVSAYMTPLKTKPITLNANEALTFKCVTNSTTGSFDFQLLFTEE